MTTGRVFLVGAGPGDPELLTVKAAALLRRADTIVYDRLIHPGVLAHARRGARLIYVGKEGWGAATSQADINRLLIMQAQLGRLVVRLKGGDPFVFGRGGEEALALAEAGVPCEVVPGVSSGIGVPALAGIPATHRGVAASVTFAAAHRADGDVDWRHLAGADTLVLFMGAAKIAEIAGALMAQGKAASEPVAIVESGSFDDQRIVEGTLASIAAVAAAACITGPALLVIGEVVPLRHRLRLARPSPPPSTARANAQALPRNRGRPEAAPTALPRSQGSGRAPLVPRGGGLAGPRGQERYAARARSQR